ncbi:MAG: ATP-binding protein, partial [Microcystis panniformis]
RIDGCQLGNINLIVGKNASGKSRIVKSIYKLSELLSESGEIDPLFRKDTWHLFFDRTTNCETEYFLELENGEVLQERLIIGSQQLLERNESGEGKIFAQELNQYIRFQTPKTELAVVKRRDNIQHPFLE